MVLNLWLAQQPWKVVNSFAPPFGVSGALPGGSAEQMALTWTLTSIGFCAIWITWVGPCLVQNFEYILMKGDDSYEQMYGHLGEDFSHKLHSVPLEKELAWLHGLNITSWRKFNKGWTWDAAASVAPGPVGGAKDGAINAWCYRPSAGIPSGRFQRFVAICCHPFTDFSQTSWCFIT